MLAAVGAVALGGVGRLADVGDHVAKYDRLVVLARSHAASPPLAAGSTPGGFTVGQRDRPDEARRLMADLRVAGVGTYAGWAWVRGRAGLFTETTRVTLVPDGDTRGRRVLAESALGGRWVEGHLVRWEDAE